MEFFSASWNAGLGAWAGVLSVLVAIVGLWVAVKRRKGVGGRGGDAIVENAEGEAYGGAGGSGGGRFGSGGDGGNARVVGGKGKAVGGKGGNG